MNIHFFKSGRITQGYCGPLQPKITKVSYPQYDIWTHFVNNPFLKEERLWLFLPSRFLVHSSLIEGGKRRNFLHQVQGSAQILTPVSYGSDSAGRRRIPDLRPIIWIFIKYRCLNQHNMFSVQSKGYLIEETCHFVAKALVLFFVIRCLLDIVCSLDKRLFGGSFCSQIIGNQGAAADLWAHIRLLME